MTSSFPQVMDSLHRELVKRGVMPCCLTCTEFEEGTEKCRLANARPPANVIVYGCPQWDDIPFS